jgi:hypothetical protein
MPISVGVRETPGALSARLSRGYRTRTCFPSWKKPNKKLMHREEAGREEDERRASEREREREREREANDIFAVAQKLRPWPQSKRRSAAIFGQFPSKDQAISLSKQKGGHRGLSFEKKERR